jgi:hypothetical protein
MAEFERLQELWQRQEAPAVSAAETERLTRSLRAYSRRQYIVNIAKAILVAGVLAWSINHAQPSLRVMAGWGLIAVAAFSLLVREWRSQRAISFLEFGRPSLDFVESTLDRLREQRDLHRRYYVPFMAAVVIGMNLTLPDMRRLWVRLMISVLPFAGFEFGLWLRRKRFDLECRPLIHQLSSMRSALQERVD